MKSSSSRALLLGDVLCDFVEGFGHFGGVLSSRRTCCSTLFFWCLFSMDSMLRS